MLQFRLTNSRRYLVVGLVELVGLVGLGLPLTVTIRVSRVSAEKNRCLLFLVHGVHLITFKHDLIFFGGEDCQNEITIVEWQLKPFLF